MNNRSTVTAAGRTAWGWHVKAAVLMALEHQHTSIAHKKSICRLQPVTSCTKSITYYVLAEHSTSSQHMQCRGHGCQLPYTPHISKPCRSVITATKVHACRCLLTLPTSLQA